MKQVTVEDYIRDPKVAEKLTTPQLIQLMTQMKLLMAGLRLDTDVPKSPGLFAQKLSKGKWHQAPHLETISLWLEELELGDKERVLVSCPPRHGKSELISFWFPLWYLAKHPDRQIILCSYEAEFAAHWGRRVRNAIMEFGDDLGLTLSDDSTAANRWSLTSGGGMITAGAGGPITGRGAHLLIVDDPIKNAEEASSETTREALWDWWQTTAYTRLEPGGVAVVIATRWHQDDLIGRLEKSHLEGAPKWDVIKFPAIAEEDDPLGRTVGQPLWPERYDLKKLEEIKSGMTPYNWSALYQQRPSPEEGGGVKRAWWNYYYSGHPPADAEVWIQSWDLAFKDLKASDYVVGQVWCRHAGRFYLVDQVRERMNSVDTIHAIRNFTMRYPKATAKLIEDKANGPAVIATLQNEVAGIIPVKPRGSKDARLEAVIPLIHSGNVHVPGKKNAKDEWVASSNWVAEFIEEHAAFPNGTNDDQVDACTQALTYLHPGAIREIGKAWKLSKEGPPPKTTNEIQQRQFHNWYTKQIKKADKTFRGQIGSAFSPHRRRMW